MGDLSVADGPLGLNGTVLSDPFFLCCLTSRSVTDRPPGLVTSRIATGLTFWPKPKSPSWSPHRAATAPLLWQQPDQASSTQPESRLYGGTHRLAAWPPQSTSVLRAEQDPFQDPVRPLLQPPEEGPRTSDWCEGGPRLLPRPWPTPGVPPTAASPHRLKPDDEECGLPTTRSHGVVMISG